GRTARFSRRLSLINACFSFASPWMTLMKSNTTRRSHPMIMSRLRRPTSKSMTTVFLPAMARPAPSAAVDVVLPTPPLPDVITIVFATRLLRSRWSRCRPPLSFESGSLQGLHHEGIVPEIGLHPLLQVRAANVVARLVEAGDRDQLGLQAGAEDARRRVAVHAGERPPAQTAIDMDIADGDQLRAGSHRRDHHQIARIGEDPLPGAHRLRDQQRPGPLIAIRL